MGDFSNREDLIRDIEYAIWRAPVRSARHSLSPTDRQMLAKAIADHLTLANWKFTRGAPSQMASTDRFMK